MSTRRPVRAFTLVELLVAMTVLSLMLVLTAQMVNQTAKVTTASSKKMDAASMGRIVLDRFGNDFATAILTNGASALYYTPLSGTGLEPKANSGIGFISETRARVSTGTSAEVTAITNDVRGSLIGYKVRNLNYGSVASPKYIPVIERGDSRFTFSFNNGDNNEIDPTDSNNNDIDNKAAYEVNVIMGSKNVIGETVKRIPDDILEVFPHTNARELNGTILNYKSLGDGVIRFHVSFVLNDGTIVQNLRDPNLSPPLNATYLNFPATGGTGAALPIAFSTNTSADVNKRYVKGLIVGLVVLDENTLRVANDIDSAFLDNFAKRLARPLEAGETPVGIWQKNLDRVDAPNEKPIFPAARQNVRFYQRFYPVNL